MFLMTGAFVLCPISYLRRKIFSKKKKKKKKIGFNL